MTSNTPSTPDAREIRALADRVEAARGFDNGLDVQCEVALFEPHNDELAIRANDAGTKIIVTFAGGREKTFVARDYTMSAMTRKYWAAALRDRATGKGGWA